MKKSVPYFLLKRVFRRRKHPHVVFFSNQPNLQIFALELQMQNLMQMLRDFSLSLKIEYAPDSHKVSSSIKFPHLIWRVQFSLFRIEFLFRLFLLFCLFSRLIINIDFTAGTVIHWKHILNETIALKLCIQVTYATSGMKSVSHKILQWIWKKIEKNGYFHNCPITFVTLHSKNWH